MRFGILGPLEVRSPAGDLLPVGGPRPRALLVMLLLTPGRVVPVERLIDGQYGDDPPGGAANAVQAQVSRLRGALPAGLIEFHGSGYRLAADPDDVDAHCFGRLAQEGRRMLSAGRHASAAGPLREALALWRGPALADLPFGRAQVARLEELRLSVAEDLFEAELALPQGPSVAELRRLATAHPLRERLSGQLMRALAAEGRPAEALEVFHETRRLLADDLGTGPSPELAAVHLAILRAEAPPPLPRQGLAAQLTTFVGREDELDRIATLSDARLITITGPGGTGKTRLAVEAAGRGHTGGRSVGSGGGHEGGSGGEGGSGSVRAVGSGGGSRGGREAGSESRGGREAGSGREGRSGNGSGGGSRGGREAGSGSRGGREDGSVRAVGSGGGSRGGREAGSEIGSGGEGGSVRESGSGREGRSGSGGGVGRGSEGGSGGGGGGVCFADLSALDADHQVPETVLGALGMRETGFQAIVPPDPTARLIAALARQDLLLVLDNCEHVIAGTATLARRLLQECPRLTILATSREPLGITGETLIPLTPLPVPPLHLPASTLTDPPSTPSSVPPLGLPASPLSDPASVPRSVSPLGRPEFSPTEPSPDIPRNVPAPVLPSRSFVVSTPGPRGSEILGYPAVRLFADRAAAVRPGFEVRGDNAEAVVRICVALDGLPLAIELAAARLRSFTVEEIAARLAEHGRFGLLSRGDRTAAARHRTLRAVVEWSWDLLTPDERELAGHFAVFTGGATLEAVEAVCELADAAGILADLVDKSLVERSGDRYRMLETIRLFCAGKLDEAGGRDRLRAAHARHFLLMAQRADPHLRRAEQLEWLARLSADHDNLIAALRWSVRHDQETALRLVAALAAYWWLSGRRSHAGQAATELLGTMTGPAKRPDGPDGHPTEAVTGHSTEAVAGRSTEAVARHPSEIVAGRSTEAVVGRSTEVVPGRPTESVAGRPTESVARHPTEAVAGRSTEVVDGHFTESVAGCPTEVVAGRPSEVVTGGPTESGAVQPGDREVRSVEGLVVPPAGLEEEYVMCVAHAVPRAAREHWRHAEAIVRAWDRPLRHPFTAALWGMVAGPMLPTTLVPGLGSGSGESLRVGASWLLGSDPWFVALARLGEGLLALLDGRPAEAERELADVLSRFRSLGERWGTAQALDWLALIASRRGEWARARGLWREALGMLEELGALEEIVDVLGRRSEGLVREGDLPAAADGFRRAEEVARQAGRNGAPAAIHLGLGEIARHEGDHLEARRRFALALDASDGGGFGADWSRVSVLTALARLAEAEGDLAEARLRHREALAVARRSPPLGTDLAGAADGQADAALLDGRPERAALLLGTAVALRGTAVTGDADVTRTASAARALLGPGSFAATYARGAALTRPEAMKTLDAR
ncbi:BTAD domain-containing putative transcriptional regulator [Sphaerisporangium corydalis]|uniref:BTAD domain-containing putative transcriptional regulator n=1 Tax=Sphaerisporangium corydalis TaxID=1441875 RepID=A0ABV9EAJ9_9ACTN